MSIKSALYILTVRKPGHEQSLTLNMVGQKAAEDAAWELRRQGYTVDWEPHGYSLYRTAEQAVFDAKWFSFN